MTAPPDHDSRGRVQSGVADRFVSFIHRLIYVAVGFHDLSVLKYIWPLRAGRQLKETGGAPATPPSSLAISEFDRCQQSHRSEDPSTGYGKRLDSGGNHIGNVARRDLP